MSYTNPIKIYIGKVDNVVICTDEHSINVRTYMEKIRHLSKHQYELTDAMIDSNSYYSFFSRERMEELTEGIILPRRDCEWIMNDIIHLDERKASLIRDLTEMSSLMKSFGEYTEARNLDLAIRSLYRAIEKKKFNKQMERAKIFTNEIFHFNIEEYFNFINMDIESQQMKDQYRYYTSQE